MKYVISIIAVLGLSSCGFYQACPAVEERDNLQTGTYVLQSLTERTDWKLRDTTDHVLTVDRASNTGTLSYQDADGRQIEITIRLDESTFVP